MFVFKIGAIDAVELPDVNRLAASCGVVFGC